MPAKGSVRALSLLASTSVVTLGLVTAPATVDLDPAQPVLNAAQADGSCFTGETLVLMADGAEKPIRDVRVGELVMGADGQANRVTGIERPRLGDRPLYSINGGGHFVTAEHPFLTAEGWKAIDPALTAAQSPGLALGCLAPGDNLTVFRATGAAVAASNVALAGLLLEKTRLRRLEARAADPATPLFNLLLDGDHAYFANGYLVHNKGGEGGEGGEGGGEGGEGGDAEAGEHGDDVAEAGESDDDHDDDHENEHEDDDDEVGHSGPGSAAPDQYYSSDTRK